MPLAYPSVCPHNSIELCGHTEEPAYAPHPCYERHDVHSKGLMVEKSAS